MRTRYTVGKILKSKSKREEYDFDLREKVRQYYYVKIVSRDFGTKGYKFTVSEFDRRYNEWTTVTRLYQEYELDKYYIFPKPAELILFL